MTSFVKGVEMGTKQRKTVEAPFGAVHVVATDAAVIAIHWADQEPEGEPCDGPHPVLDAAAAQLTEYFAGARTDFDLPLAPGGTAFQQQAWAALREIPFGATISYGDQAKRLGDANKSRAVGAANGQNPIPIVVPCHRVVGSTGKLTGFAGGLATKAWLLEHEQRVLGNKLF
jgi:methylated-DNA-[protein]-cysteine S-methyltransferase